MKYIQKFLKDYQHPIVFWLLWLSYLLCSAFWTNYLPTQPTKYYLEFLLTLTWYLMFPSNTMGTLGRLLVVLGWYLTIDLYFVHFHAFWSLSDLENFIDLAFGAPEFFLMAITASLGVISLNYFAWKKAEQSFKWNGISLLALFVLGVFLSLEDRLHSKIGIQRFSNVINAKEYGRFTTVWFAEITRVKNQKELATLKYQSQQNRLWGERMSKPNIHVFLMESFADANNYLGNPCGSVKPAENFSALGLEFSTAITPVYGGGTAQVEWEMLTGTQAKREFGSTEFNLLTGAPLSSWVNRLNNLSYKSVASVASEPHFFNVIDAYQSIGFHRSDFIKDNGYPQATAGEQWLFDGDLLEQNITKIQMWKKPYFNYVVGIYGHYAYNRNFDKRPDVLSCGNSEIARISNQFYYRTKALAHWVADIEKSDSNAVILAFGDHLPPILNESITYAEKDRYHIPVILRWKGKTQNLPTLYLHQIPMWIETLLSKEPVFTEEQIIDKSWIRHKIENSSIDWYKYLIWEGSR